MLLSPIHDTKPASLLDLSTQYFITEQDIGKNRAAISHAKIAELNPYCKVDTSDVDLASNLDVLSGYQCVVVTDTTHEVAEKIDAYCHKNNIVFIRAETRGVFVMAFSDFGKGFEVHDKDGEELKSFYLSDIKKDGENSVVTCLENHMHGLEDGDLVKLTEIVGMDGLNFDETKNNLFRIKSLTPTTFAIDADVSKFGKYESGGLCNQVKDTLKVDHLPLSESVEKPEMDPTDWAKMEAPGQLHIAFQALDAFTQSNNGELPQPWNETDAATVLSKATEINARTAAKVEKLDEKLIKYLSFTARGNIIGNTAFLGGFVGQEVLKACSGKFTPLKQWLYLDCTELLPAEIPEDMSDYAPVKSRYDAQIICIGNKVNQKLLNQKVFMIGAGAIGCEMMKNYAMMGIGAGENGLVTLTDNDLIETSNLNRQFLFREKDIQSPKSSTAAAAAKAMNPSLKVNANLDRIEPKTESKYDNAFFKSTDIIINALDNVQARMYVDQRCITNLKPLLESGTLGTKAHVQVIMPHLTETYQDQRDPPEVGVPFCTIKSFPAKIDHCIQWARDKFESLFAGKPSELASFYGNPEEYVQGIESGQSRPLFKSLKFVLKNVEKRPANFADCVQLARHKFEGYFFRTMKNLLHVFPLDMRVKDGSKFWTLPKRPPTPLVFDINNKHHLDFVTSTASIYAHIFNVETSTDLNLIKQACESVVLPEWKPKNKKIETDETKGKEEAVAEPVDDDAYKTTLNSLKEYIMGLAPFTPQVEDFEKDDDSNHHIDFITAAANLRASCYGIEPSDRMECKRISGRIIPAIATTTTSVAGLVSTELMKLVIGLKLEAFKNAFVNLGLPLMTLSEPAPPKKTKITGDSYYTVWDQWQFSEDEYPTLEEFCNYFKGRYNLKVTGVIQGVKMVYAAFMPGHKKRLPKKISALIRGSNKMEYVDLVVTYENLDGGEDVNGPTVRYTFSKKA